MGGRILIRRRRAGRHAWRAEIAAAAIGLTAAGGALSEPRGGRRRMVQAVDRSHRSVLPQSHHCLGRNAARSLERPLSGIGRRRLGGWISSRTSPRRIAWLCHRNHQRVLRIYEMPKVDVHIVASNAAPTGVGEPGVPPLAPAVANALARLGVPRVRRLPLVRAGLVAG